MEICTICKKDLRKGRKAHLVVKLSDVVIGESFLEGLGRGIHERTSAFKAWMGAQPRMLICKKCLKKEIYFTGRY